MATYMDTMYQLAEMLAADFSWETETYKAAILDETYDFSARTQTTYASVSDSEISDSNYTAGGNALTSKSVETVSYYTYFRAASLAWGSMSVEFKYIIVYNATTGYIACYLDFDDTSSSSTVTLTAEALSVNWTNNYLFRIYNP